MKKRFACLLSVLMVSSSLMMYGCSTKTPPAQPKNQSETAAKSQDDIQPTDYSSTENWMKLPDQMQHDVDVLYFYPTVYTPENNGPTVSPIIDDAMRTKAQGIYQIQATAFEPAGDMYAPYYRQVDAAALAGLTQEEMIENESGEPKTDVFAALDYYFEHYNNDRPYILCGHSQGAMMIYIILDEYMENHPEEYENMVAAYMIGNAATRDWLEENPHVRMAEGEGDTGVLVTWNTEGPGNADAYNMVVPEGSVCINPLNWKTDETYAGVEENEGCLVDGQIVEGFADAQIDLDRGSVVCTSVDPDDYATDMEALFGPESYHPWDFGFYYANLRENAQLRADNFLAQAQ